MNTNQKTETEKTENEIELAEKTATVCGEEIAYSLLFRKESDVCFVLRVKMRGEQTETVLGNDLFFAADAFRKIVRGGVTPCTLDEVLSDLRYESNFRKTSLQKRDYMVK